MSYRLLMANEFSEFLRAIAHPRRIQIIEELRSRELDVGTLQQALNISPSNVSQHLAILRVHRVVSEHREGRRVVYRLCSPQLAAWLVDGMQFLPAVAQEVDQVKRALRSARVAWSSSKNSKQNSG